MLAAIKESFEMETVMQSLDTNIETFSNLEMRPSMEFVTDMQHDAEFKTHIRHSVVWTNILRLDELLSEAFA